MKDTWELCTVFETLSLSFQTKRLSNKFTVYSAPFSKLRRGGEEDKDCPRRLRVWSTMG